MWEVDWLALMLVHVSRGWLCAVVVVMGVERISVGVEVREGDCATRCARPLLCDDGLLLW